MKVIAIHILHASVDCRGELGRGVLVRATCYGAARKRAPIDRDNAAKGCGGCGYKCDKDAKGEHVGRVMPRRDVRGANQFLFLGLFMFGAPEEIRDHEAGLSAWA